MFKGSRDWGKVDNEGTCQSRGFAHVRACHAPAYGRSAGSQTTGNTITAIFVYLLNHRSCYEQVKKEIREKFSTIADITTKSVRELPYLDAMLHEGTNTENHY